MKSGNPGRGLRRPALQRAAALLSLAALGALTACETQEQRIAHEDRDLAMDGFLKKPADTPARHAMLVRLPRDHLLQRVTGGGSLYVYSDPTVCNCIYVGTQRAYNNYKADRQSVDILPYDDPSWNWNAWGPWPGGYGLANVAGFSD